MYWMLCGEYGVCSMCSDLNDDSSIVMYVVVLIWCGDEIIGVLMIVKLN